MEHEYVGDEVDAFLSACAEADGPLIREVREERVRDVLGGLPAVVVRAAGEPLRWARRWVTVS